MESGSKKSIKRAKRPSMLVLPPEPSTSIAHLKSSTLETLPPIRNWPDISELEYHEMSDSGNIIGYLDAVNSIKAAK